MNLSFHDCCIQFHFQKLLLNFHCITHKGMHFQSRHRLLKLQNDLRRQTGSHRQGTAKLQHRCLSLIPHNFLQLPELHDHFLGFIKQQSSLISQIQFLAQTFK